MEVALVSNCYGKSRVRLMKVVRHPTRHDLYEWTVQVMLTGDFDSAHVHGDNSKLLTTDAMKNMVYSRARASSATTIEHFAIELADFLLSRNPQVASAEVHIASALWKHIQIDGRPHPTTFMHGSKELQTTTITRQRDSLEITSGLDHLLILKTGDSAFEGFLKDSLTTLPEASDRLLGTVVKADWHYNLPEGLREQGEPADSSGPSEIGGPSDLGDPSHIGDPADSDGPSDAGHSSGLGGPADPDDFGGPAGPGRPSGALDFITLRTTIRETLLRTFAEHKSKSVQHTLYAMGEAALVAVPQIGQIDLLMPNKHCLLVDLSPFGQDNPNEIFIPIDEPHGTIQASLRRKP